MDEEEMKEIAADIVREWTWLTNEYRSFMEVLEVKYIEEFGGDPGKEELRHTLVDAIIAENSESHVFLCAALSSLLSRLPSGMFNVFVHDEDGESEELDRDMLASIIMKTSELIGGEQPNKFAVAAALSCILSRMPTADYTVES